jgi:hypothetical protein
MAIVKPPPLDTTLLQCCSSSAGELCAM